MPKSMSPLPSTEVTPRLELEKRTRRYFSPEYKLRIIHEGDACRHGELGGLLRGEKLYHTQLSQWRRELAQGGVESLGKTRPGPRVRHTPPAVSAKNSEK